MKYLYPALGLIVTLLVFSCEKENSNISGCPTEATTERIVMNKPATVREIGGTYYIIEQNTIDTRLIPCDLDAAFKVDNLQVVISGEVKKTSPSPGVPCCTNNFVITSITK